MTLFYRVGTLGISAFWLCGSDKLARSISRAPFTRLHYPKVPSLPSLRCERPSGVYLVGSGAKTIMSKLFEIMSPSMICLEAVIVLDTYQSLHS